MDSQNNKERRINDKVERIMAILRGEEIPMGYDTYIIHITFENEAQKKNGLILEGKEKYTQIPGTTFYYRKDVPFGEHRKGNQIHYHFFTKDGKELFAINQDGTAHDGCHGIIIPQEIVDFLRQKGFTIPKNNLIESVEKFFNWSPNSRILLLD